MKYYKIIKDNNFIGIASSTNIVRYQQRNHCFVSATEADGEFIECNGQLYHSGWLRPVPNNFPYPFEQVIIVEITEEEYNIYYSAIEHNEEIIEQEEEEIETTPTIFIDPIEEVSVEFMKSSKIAEMSSICRATIEAGFDLNIRGETRHFSLTMQDQLNLMNLSIMAQTQDLIPYHADGEETTFYAKEEINMIVQAATELKVYNTTYYNALKTYINSLETIEEISAITYGTPIPDEYKTDVLKTLE